MVEYNLSIDQVRHAHTIATKLMNLRVQLHGLRAKLDMSDTMLIGRSDRHAEGGVAGYIQVNLPVVDRDRLQEIIESSLRNQISTLEATLAGFGVNPDFSTVSMAAEDEALILGVLK